MCRGSRKMPQYRLNRQKKHSLKEYGLMVLPSKGFTRIEESDMLLNPDPATYTILPWRSNDTRVARFVCDVYT